MQPDLFSQPPSHSPIKFAERATPPKANTAPPQYYRCPECLTTFTTADKLGAWGKYHAAKCACGSERAEYLGQSTVDRLMKKETLCACDYRCTEARGPNCTCKCGGVNHGSGLMIEVIRDNGPIPVLKMKSAELCKLQAQQWQQAQRDAIGRINAKHGDDMRKFNNRIWLERETWEAINNDHAQLNAARKLTSQKGRMEKIAKVGR